MERLLLVRPDESMEEEIAGYRRDFLATANVIEGSGALAGFADPAAWLAFTRRVETEEGASPIGWVPSLQFVCLRASDGRLVGMLQLRTRFNDFLRKFGGNIGYSVRPGERRKGYAARMLAMALPRAREAGLTRALITCAPDNEGSRRTILKNGGVYESTVYNDRDGVWLMRYWIELAETAPGRDGGADGPGRMR
ncbi:MAG TPA: GNAT family N-acetyltransferase [Candidatus Pullichristensenella avicola]|nr:GNAT family N-acetyltransferase [Candidatus Pullichristensenella avicola]